jgi:hypothetical protein
MKTPRGAVEGQPKCMIRAASLSESLAPQASSKGARTPTIARSRYHNSFGDEQISRSDTHIRDGSQPADLKAIASKYHPVSAIDMAQIRERMVS